MKHIAYTLLRDGQPTGHARALCGVVVTSLSAGNGKLCPECKRLDEEGA